MGWLSSIGTAVGGFFGGPAGAKAGGSVGGWLGDQVSSGAKDLASKGINYGFDRLGAAIGGAGGPQTPSGSEMGQRAKDYYDSAFPGTNPWERLGTSAPGGAIEVARESSRVQRSNVKRQTDTSFRVAKMQARSAAVTASAHLGPNAIKAAGDYAAHGTDPRLKGKSPAQIQAGASQIQAKTGREKLGIERELLALRQKIFRMDVGKAFNNPATATLRAITTRAWEQSIDRADLDRALQDHYQSLLAGGVGIEALSGLSRALNIHLGRLFGPRRVSKTGNRKFKKFKRDATNTGPQTKAERWSAEKGWMRAQPPGYFVK